MYKRQVLNQSLLAISDSGGVQEEAPSLGVPVIITRSTTERPEILGTGMGYLAAVSYTHLDVYKRQLHGVSTKESILYCTHKPCSLCAKMIINAGISRIVYQNPYPDPLSLIHI